MGMKFTEETIAEDEKRWGSRDVVMELGYCGNNMRDRRNMTNLDIRFYAYIMRKAHEMLKAQEPPKNASISSAIECLLHPQDADDSDMTKAIDTAVRAMRSLRDQEPRVMTLEEVKSATGSDLFLEISGHPDAEPYMTAVTLEGVGSKGISVYGNTFDFVRYNLHAYGWRLWTSRPTEEQREATPWQ